MGNNYELPLTVEAYINGQVTKAENYEKRENPSDVSKIAGYYPKNTEDDALQAIAAADDAFKEWKNIDIATRVSKLKEAIEQLKAHRSEITQLLSEEHGKPLYDAQNEFDLAMIGVMEFNIGNAEETFKEVINEDDMGKVVVRNEPIGVVSAISPWNYPLALSMEKVSAAIVAGNTMVLKPSPMAPLTVTVVAHIIAECLPKGVLNILHGDAEIGQALTTDSRVKKIAFTGGTKTGSAIMKSAADTIKNITLELGGNDAAIFLDDFDVEDDEAMKRVVISNFLTSGQICMIAKRMYVPESIYDRFVKRYQAVANEWLKIGSPLNSETRIGPMNNKPQLDFIKELIEDSKQHGYQTIELGQVIDEDIFDKGYFMHPTLVLGAEQSSRVVQEEQFGLVAPIIKVKDEEEALKFANELDLGLTSSVWGEESHAIDVARQVEAGVTMINTAALQGLDIRYPFGGVKQSGIGREYGIEGLKAYTETHVITVPIQKTLPNTL